MFAIAQTPDGYLWIGAEKGLIRFDGVHFRPFRMPGLSAAVPIVGLVVDVEGTLWIRQGGGRLARYREGVFSDAPPGANGNEGNVTAMGIGRDGEILFSGLGNGTVRYQEGKLVALATPTELPKVIYAVAETPDGKVWLGSNTGLYFLSEGKASAAQGLPDRKINALLATDREVWVGTDNGIALWDGVKFSQAGGRGLEHIQALTLAKDRDSNVWVGTSSGLLRVSAKGVSRDAGEPAMNVSALFEDREGNLWVGTGEGLERLQDGVFTTYGTQQGLPPEHAGPLYADTEDRTWFGGLQGGLYWLKDGKARAVKQAGLDRDVVYSISGAGHDLWVGRQHGGLTHLYEQGDALVQTTYTVAEGLAQNSVYSVQRSRDGAVWAGTLSAGVSRLKNGTFTTYSTANGLASNMVASIAEGPDETMWFGTPNGVSAFANGKWRTYTSSDGLPPGTANCLFEDSAGVLWVGTANGLAFIRAGTVQSLSEGPEALHEGIFGITEDRAGWLWIAGANHLERVSREKALSLSVSTGDVRVFGFEDGLRGVEGIRRDRSLVRDAQGRIWVATSGGLAMADATRPAREGLPAMVQIEAISADGRAIPLKEPVRIAAPHQRITLSYVGLSLAAPERVAYRFKLDGFDADWGEPVTNREAVYTNLGAGSYRFSVMASNSEGLWNSAERAIGFEIEPLYWQTWWFRAAGGALLAIAGLGFWRLRVFQLTQQLNMRFEERLAERTRIAQELHDTLLQGLVSASMQLHVADEHVASDSAAKPLVRRVLELMRRGIEEGRNAVRGLRSAQGATPELGEAFSRIRQEFPGDGSQHFRVIVEGTAQPLRPLIRDEIYSIGREALTNAFRHAKAERIEVELEYAPEQLRILVRDNGVGVDPDVVKAGREGHWGLSGMRERAKRIGASLRVLSRAAAGTEVELVIPGGVAFETDSGHSASTRAPRLLAKSRGIVDRLRSRRESS